MVDCIESYGYSKSLMSELSGYQIPQSLNVGIIGLKTSMIDWNKLEEWIVVMERREGTSYYLEQALSAMIFSKHKTMALDRNCYLVNPLPEQPKSTLHHYVSTSKKEYFNSEWKRILA
ncbi:MAG: hypothetical protein EOP48_14150 [Sphingobacteriales bacterium]|nr:MAG: hypothetical protein EOP48_14150 [Sphingobacteriales bacterium]